MSAFVPPFRTSLQEEGANNKHGKLICMRRPTLLQNTKCREVDTRITGAVLPSQGLQEQFYHHRDYRSVTLL